MASMGSPPLTGSAARPVEIRLKRAERVLELRFDDGLHVTLSAELLRVESPSAEVQGHGPSQKTIVAGKRNVAITTVEPVGHYAVRLVFDDGHDTGIYSWTYLHELATRQDELWRAYLAALEARGLSRG
ncbi:gamma-butyrobetaine hydroxylase-like domain-containing protein [Inquilinus limosus]|uniref:gamma-butyrobetaine hydroxylase-like domain-containing protein n=1 Tax=Inquilinus limosus TaxID=171674 RepID=UPI000688916C